MSKYNKLINIHKAYRLFQRFIEGEIIESNDIILSKDYVNILRKAKQQAQEY